MPGHGEVATKPRHGRSRPGGPCPKQGELGVPASGGPSSGWPGQRVQPRDVAAFLTRSLAGARAAGAALASACLIHRSPGRAGAAAVPAPRSRRPPRPLRPWVLRWATAFLFSFWGVMGGQRAGGPSLWVGAVRHCEMMPASPAPGCGWKRGDLPSWCC